MKVSSGSYVKLSERLYYGIHPQIVKPSGMPEIDHYVSLVEAHEVPPSPDQSVETRYHEFPIKDRGAPTLTYLRTIVDFILSLEEGVIYLFCKGGHGRSGTVAAAVYGTIHDLSGVEAMAHINKEWHTQRNMRYIRPKIRRLGSPQTAIQKRTVIHFLSRDM